MKLITVILSLSFHAIPAAALTLSCSPDIPVTRANTTVTVRAFALSASPKYTWTVTAGSIAETTAEAHWILQGVSPGIYRATVQVQDAAAAASCSIRLVVTGEVRSSPGSPALDSGSAFLLASQTEESGYGLYSYLLLGSPPIESTRERYTQVIKAYLNLLTPLDQLRQSSRPKDLNATYLLLTAKALTAEAPKDIPAKWVLDNYDYARARSILRLLRGRGQLRVGPYFVSSTTPLLGSTETPHPYLLQDMSAVPTVPVDLLSWWVREFMNQAAQQRFWDTRNAEQFTLKLRTTLSVLSAGLPEVLDSLKDWVHWFS